MGERRTLALRDLGAQRVKANTAEEACAAAAATLANYSRDIPFALFIAYKAYSPADALHLAESIRLDIILSDVLMPKMSGIEMCIRIRDLLPEARVVLLSGQAATAELMRRAAAEGYEFELLPKPIHPEELVARLKQKSK